MTEPAPAPWSDAARRFIDDPTRFATIATIDPHGLPRLAVVWYRLQDGTVLINSRIGRRWPADLQRDPRVSLSVSEANDYVIVRGRAEVVATGPQALADIQALARRYRSDPAEFDGQQRITFLVRPEHVATHGRIA
ncbi:MAG TPA: TIGR03618 family F420-dependent PPOX class oxidoreductase [Candidatus Limnocylindrales bacterium]|nr:TIGR03618 family F420-dependent PPOX class oxidoreductase [Candidatus Limnocylindrales bacterium]